MWELGIPALACHTFRGDIHCALVVCALSLDTGSCYFNIGVLGRV